MIKVNNHWGHWQDHIIVFGVEPVSLEIKEKNITRTGLEICLFGIGLQIYFNRFIDWVLVKFYKFSRLQFFTRGGLFNAQS